MESFAEQLAAARKAAGMTQEQLADAVHVARNTVSTWEHGRSLPNIEMLRTLGRVLHTDFLTDASSSREDNMVPDQELPGETASADQYINEEKNPFPKKGVLIGAIVFAAVLVCAFLIILPSLKKRMNGVVTDAAGNRYAISDYNQTTPNVQGKAYLTIIKTLSVRPGGGTDFYSINFTAREDNGIAFRVDRLDMVIFFEDKADVYSFTYNDLLATGEINPDIPAYGTLSIDNGFPTNQKGLLGMAMKIMGTDANGAALTFTAYIPIP